MITFSRRLFRLIATSIRAVACFIGSASAAALTDDPLLMPRRLRQNAHPDYKHIHGQDEGLLFIFGPY